MSQNNQGVGNQTAGSVVRLNQNTTHEQTYDEDSKVVVVDDHQVVSSTQDGDEDEGRQENRNELGSEQSTEAHIKFIAALKSELESARTLIMTQKAQMLALIKRTRDMNNELKTLRA